MNEYSEQHRNIKYKKQTVLLEMLARRNTN